MRVVAPGGALLTPLGSKGANYTLVVRAALSGAPGVLLAGPDDSFGLAPAPGGGGALTLAFTSSNITYPLSNFTLPRPSLQAKTLTEIVLMGTEEGTSTFVNGVHAGDFLVAIDGTTVMEPMALDIANTWKAGPRVVDVEKGADTRTGGHQASAACFMAVLLVRASRSGPWHGEALANPMAV